MGMQQIGTFISLTPEQAKLFERDVRFQEKVREDIKQSIMKSIEEELDEHIFYTQSISTTSTIIRATVGMINKEVMETEWEKK